MAKSWEAKFFSKKNFEIKTIQKDFWGHVAGSKMLIPTPFMIQEYINHIESGTISDVEIMRNDLAIEHGADFTCPMTTGIFLRIVAEYNYENLSQKRTEICPFWRIIDPNSKLSDRLSFDKKFIIDKRDNEENQY
jgi:hypothetical protein